MIAIVDIGNAIEGRDGAYIVRGGTAGYTRLRTGEFFTFDEMIQHYSRCGGVERSSARRPRNPARPKPAACSVCALAALKPTAEPVDALCGLGGISQPPSERRISEAPWDLALHVLSKAVFWRADDCINPLFYWRARKDSNLRPPDS
jgi:hypothetical protein